MCLTLRSKKMATRYSRYDSHQKLVYKIYKCFSFYCEVPHPYTNIFYVCVYIYPRGLGFTGNSCPYGVYIYEVGVGWGGDGNVPCTCTVGWGW